MSVSTYPKRTGIVGDVGSYPTVSPDLSAIASFGPIVNRALVADVYIDPTAASGGNGSASAPFNNFDQCNRLSGDQSNNTIYLKCGEILRDQLALSGVTNLRVRPYGASVGSMPIISGADVVPFASWRDDTATTAGMYSISSGYSFSAGTSARNGNPNGASTTSATAKACYVSGVQMLYSTNAPASLPVGYMTLNGGRIYIRPTGSALSSADLIEVSCRQYGLFFLGASGGIDVRGIQVNYAAEQAFCYNATGNNAVFENCAARYTGNFGTGGTPTGGRNGFMVYGSKTSPITGVKIVGNTCVGANNNGAEIWGVTGAIVAWNRFTSCGQGVEIWGYVTNSEISYNRLVNNLGSTSGNNSNSHGSGIWQTYDFGSDTGHNTGNTIAFNLVDGSQGGSIDIQAGSANVYNNTCIAKWITSDSPADASWTGASRNCLFLDKNDVTTNGNAASYVVRNNVFVSLFSSTAYGGSAPQLVQFGMSGTINNTTFVVDADYNTYWAPNKAADTFPANFLVMVFNNSGKGTFAAYKSAIQAVRAGAEANSYLEDVKLTSANGGDYTLQAASPAKAGQSHPGVAGLGYYGDIVNAYVQQSGDTPAAPSRGCYS